MNAENSSNLTSDNDTQNILSQQSLTKPDAGSVAHAASITPTITITHGYDNAGSKVGDFTSGSTIDDTTPALFGQTTPKGTVRIYVDNVSKGYATADASGNWTITLSGLSNGSHTIRAELLNGFSKVATSEDFIINIGVSAPIITAVLDDAGHVKGHLDQNDWTDDLRPELTGAAEPGHLVNIYNGATLLGNTVANASGVWRFTPEFDLGLGTHNLVAQAQDANGIISGLSSPWSITVVSPVSISHGSDSAGGIVGDFTSGETIDDTRPTIYGQATPNISLRIYVDSVWVGDTTADHSGNWSFKLNGLSNGSHTINADLMNGSVLVSRSDDFVIKVSVLSVPEPIITAVLDDVGAVKGPLEQNASTDDVRPELTGKAEPGHLVKIYDGGTLLGSTMADESGLWRYTLESTLSEGKHSLVAEALDAVGNISNKSNAWTITVTTAPVSITHGYDSAGATNGNFASGATVDDNTPTLYGQATPNGWVDIYVDNVKVGSRVADASGNWTHMLTGLNNGPHSIRAELVKDWVTVGKSEEFVINVSVVSVQPPVITAVLDDAGTVKGPLAQNASTDDVRPELMGTAEPGRMVKLYDGTTLLGSTVADESGFWRYTLQSDLSHGKHNLVAEALDAIGNTSEKSIPWAITVGTNTSGVSITHGYDNAGAIVGNFNSGATVDDTTPTLHGQATPNGTLWIYVDNVMKGQIKADAAGNWSYTLSDLTEGSHSITASLVNGWAMVAKSAEFVINVNTSLVQAPVITVHETTDLTDSGVGAGSAELHLHSPANSGILSLSIADVLEVGEQDLFQTTDGMQISAADGDNHELNNAVSSSLDAINWDNSGNAGSGNAVYTNYQHSSLDTQLLTQQELMVNIG